MKTELERIKEVFNGFWEINLHQHRRGGYRFTGVGGGKCVIGSWGVNRERALLKFLNKIKEEN